jgi:hypothetical protein
MSKDLLKQLSTPFPEELEGTLNKGGMAFRFVSVNEVIARLNEVLGVENWTFEVISCERTLEGGDNIIAHVRLSALVEGKSLQRDAYGGAEVKAKKNGGLLDLGNDHKIAVSDGLKKAASMIGVGLYLYRSEEALAHEAHTSEDPEARELYDNFSSLIAKFDKPQKEEVAIFWKEHAGERPKPKPDAMGSVEDLTALVEKCVAISFGAETVNE